MTIDINHPFVPATPGDSRSPCPALNALANHGYLPHDGRNLTITQLISAVRKVYGLSWPFATILAIGGVAKCGHWSGLQMSLDLHELAKHNAVEHDGSLVHADTAPGDIFAPTNVDEALLRQLLDTSDTDHLSRRDLCRAQVRRQSSSRPLNSQQSTISKGELDLIYEVFGVPASSQGASDGSLSSGDDELVVPKAFLKEWLGDERLPESWDGPFREISLTGLLSHVKEITKVEQELVLSGKTAL